MAQETAPLQTNNSVGGFFGNLFSGLSSLVSSAAPVAANVYQLKLQADVLKNQSSGQLAQVQAQQQLAATQATVTAAATAQKYSWIPYAILAAFVLAIVAVIVRRRMR